VTYQEALTRSGREEADKLRANQRRPARKHTFIVDRPAKRRSFTFRLTTDDYDKLEQLRVTTGAETLSQLLLRALGAYDLLVEHIGRGFEVEFKSPDEYCSEEELEEVEQELARLIGSGGKASG